MRRVLVVDRDLGVAESLRAALGDGAAVDVLHRGSAEQAMEGVAAGDFDLCLVDEGSGPVDGFTLGAMMLEARPDSRMVLLSARLTPSVRQRALEHGFRGVLAKPVAPAVLAMLLEGPPPGLGRGRVQHR